MKRSTQFPLMNDNKPTMPQLQSLERKDGGGKSVRIMERIGANYHELGTYLLNDDSGHLLNTIKTNARDDVMKINQLIFEDWLAGRGKDVNWEILVCALREKSQLNILADDIESALDTYNYCHIQPSCNQ